MSNYTIPSSVDVKSSLSDGRIDVYNPSGSNYVVITAPSSLSGNVDFTLPSTAGTTGQYLQRTGPTSLGWGTPSVFSNAPFPYTAITRRAGSTTENFNITSTTFQNASYVPFPGTSVYGGIPPSSIIVIIGTSDDLTTAQIRVLDLTNVTTIASATTSTFATDAVNLFNLGTISNVPASSAVWQFQVRRESGAGTVRMYGYAIWG
jgi:hypothetical protein